MMCGQTRPPYPPLRLTDDERAEGAEGTMCQAGWISVQSRPLSLSDYGESEQSEREGNCQRSARKLMMPFVLQLRIVWL